MSYSVEEIADMDARQLEDMGNFYVNGIVEGKVNLGFIKALKLKDSKSIRTIFIFSDRTTLPSNNKETVLSIKLYRELSLDEQEFIIFEEVSD